MSQHEERRTAVGYVRVSSDEQVEGLSLRSQEDKSGPGISRRIVFEAS